MATRKPLVIVSGVKQQIQSGDTIDVTTFPVVDGAHGGTGVNNGSNTITLGGNISTASSFTTSGAFALTLTSSGITNATFPNGSITLVDLTSSQTLSSKTLTSPTINGAALSGTFSGSPTFSGAVTHSVTGSSTQAAIILSGSTARWVDFGSTGLAAPAVSTRSLGTKFVLFNSLDATHADYAMGIESQNLWLSVADGGAGFKWYAGASNIASLSGAGALTISSSATLGNGSANYFVFTPSVAGSTPSLSTAGSDPNVGLTIFLNGSGNFGVETNQPRARMQVDGLGPGNVVATISSVDTSTDIITTSAAHGLSTGDMVFVQYGAGGSLGGAPNMSVWFANALSTTTLTLHLTLNEAVAGSGAQNLTSFAGTVTLLGAYRVFSAKGGSTANGSSNALCIDTLSYRYSSGTDWTTTSTRLQFRVDVTPQGYIEFNPSSNSNGIKYGAPGGYHTFATSNGEQFRVSNSGTTAANYVNITGATTGSPATIASAGDAAAGLTISTATYGEMTFSKTRDATTATKFNFNSVGGLSGDANGGAFWRGVHHTAPIINVSSSNVFPHASHYFEYDSLTDPTVKNYYITVGNTTVAHQFVFANNTGGGFYFSSRFANSSNNSFEVGINSSDVNWVKTSGGTSGNSPSITAAGAGTNLDLLLTGKGSGVVKSAGAEVVNISATQTLSGKTLTTPQINGGTVGVTATVTAGTNAQGQGALTTDLNVITTSASNPSGATLPTATTGREIIVVNKGANAVNVYPASGAQIDALGNNIAISLPVGGVMRFSASSTTQWYSSYNLTVPSSGSPSGPTLGVVKAIAAGWTLP